MGGIFIDKYALNEVIDLVKNKERLFLVIGGDDNYYIRFEDLPDYIVDTNKDLIIYEFNYNTLELDEALTTYDFFINKCDYNLRAEIVDRLVKLQNYQEVTSNYKVIENDTFLLAVDILKLNLSIGI